MQEKQLKILKKFLIQDPDWMWDEWNLYFHFDSLVSLLKDYEFELKTATEGVDYVCSLGKSGIVFATYIALLAKKPLIIFSVGEFMNEGAYVIGFSDNDKGRIKGSKILVVDSHTHTGNTFRMMNDYLEAAKVNSATWFVIADCRDIDLKVQMKKQYDVRSLFDFEEEMRSEFLKIIKNKYLLSRESFWMKDQEYWLGRDDFRLNVNSEDKSFIDQVDSKVQYFNIKEFLKYDSNAFVPIDIYVDVMRFKKITDHFNESVCYGSTNEKDKCLIVPMTLAAVPIAVSVGFLHLERKDSVKILFPLFRSDAYYREAINTMKGASVILIDDVLTTGGLIAAFYKKFLEKEDFVVILLSFMKLMIGVNEDQRYSKYYYYVASEVIDNNGCVVVGKYE